MVVICTSARIGFCKYRGKLKGTAATICSSGWFGVFIEQSLYHGVLTYFISFSVEEYNVTMRFTLKAHISYYPVSLGLTWQSSGSQWQQLYVWCAPSPPWDLTAVKLIIRPGEGFLKSGEKGFRRLQACLRQRRILGLCKSFIIHRLRDHYNQSWSHRNIKARQKWEDYAIIANILVLYILCIRCGTYPVSCLKPGMHHCISTYPKFWRCKWAWDANVKD